MVQQQQQQKQSIKLSSAQHWFRIRAVPPAAYALPTRDLTRIHHESRICRTLSTLCPSRTRRVRIFTSF